jgi:2-keto-4-pentenoate hydratase/2-oxohepta-3-ene-1,7-dioic acid hydratase in catechol pathway
MKLIRFGNVGNEKPGVLLEDGTRLDVSEFGRDYDETFFGGDGAAQLEKWLAQNAAKAPRIDSQVRLGCPIVRPNKIVCIGLNYRDHAAETGGKIPAEPILFFKSTYALVGPNDDLVIPRNSEKTDWEVELAVIIGKKTSHVLQANAMKHIAGYALHNDYSERAFQLERGGQWVKGKSCDTFAPLGPFVATADEIPDPGTLGMWLRVNGEIRQKSTTANMIFDVPTLVSYVTEFMTLLPGDIISTGTPAGVGLGMKPPTYLKAGDVIELGIDSLGESRQKAVAWSPS